MPWISASTDFAAYRETFDVPGAVFFGVTYTTDLQSWIDRLGQPTTACATSSSEPYDDGAFVGLATTFEQCGATGQASLRSSRRTPATTRRAPMSCRSRRRRQSTPPCSSRSSASFNAVGITTTVDEDDAAPAAAPAAVPRTTVGSDPGHVARRHAARAGDRAWSGGPPPSVAAGPFTPSNSIAEGAMQITDDTRTITVAVPPDWAESANGFDLGGPAADPRRPALAGFAPGGVTGQAFTTPGVRFVARPFTADTSAAVIAAAAGRLPCTPGTVQEYQDPVFTGHILQLTDCGGHGDPRLPRRGEPGRRFVDRVAGHPGHGHRRQRPADRLVHVRCRPEDTAAPDRLPRRSAPPRPRRPRRRPPRRPRSLR